MTLLGSTLVPHGMRLPPEDAVGVPRPHDLVLPPLRADEWLLYDQASPSASGAQGLAIGRVFSADGVLVATVAQEPDPAPRLTPAAAALSRGPGGPDGCAATACGAR